jgi:hypothetical protein
MAQRQIPNLTPVVALSPTAQVEIVQNGTTFRASAGQIADLNANLNIKLINNIADGNICFPLYSTVTNSESNILYTSDPHYQYVPVDGRLSALRVEAKQGIFLNANSITLNYTIPPGDNAMSAGPVAVASSITVPTGSNWVVV